MCTETAALLSQTQKKKCSAGRDPGAAQGLCTASRKVASTIPWLPTPTTLHGRGYLEVLNEMPSFSLIQQLLLSPTTNKQILFQIHKSILLGNS